MVKIYVFLFGLLLPFTLSAQRAEKVCGEYTYYSSLDKSPEEAKRIALERAKIEALAEKFGATVSQNNFTNVKNENGYSSIDFHSIGGSEVKGEWLETIDEPEFQVSIEQNQLVVTVKVCGKAREVVRAEVEFTAALLRNGTEDKFKSEEFRDGDDVYLSFVSPANGFLAVYLVDNEQKVYCLLPYRQSSGSAMEVKHGRSYLFFSAKKADNPAEVDEYVLTAEKEEEHNQFYIIFSPQSFTKANDSALDETLPRELTFPEFQKWLGKNRNRDKQMQVSVQNITIKK